MKNKIKIDEEGLLVSREGSLVYKLSNCSVYGFTFGRQSRYFFGKGWDFSNDGYWEPATPEQEGKFIEMLKKECEKCGLFEDTKVEKNADGFGGYGPSFNSYSFPPTANITEIWNKNGQIFHKGKFATPIKK